MPSRTNAVRTQIRSIGDHEARQVAQKLVQQQAVVAVPTDTVYGICCRFDCADALIRLYEIKGRPPEKAIPLLIGDAAQLARFAQSPLSPLAKQLIAQFWPGPLTLVLAAQPGLPKILTAGQPTIGVRLPDHPELCTLLHECGPLATTSANLSGGAETTSAGAVYAQLAGRLPLILADTNEAEPWAETTLMTIPARQASTVVDLSQMTTRGPQILRAGALSQEISQLLSLFGYEQC